MMDSKLHNSDSSTPSGACAAARHRRDRGRDAAAPLEIPPPGWRDIARRSLASINDNHLSIISAGVAFFLLLGIIPALAAALMIYGYISNPADFQSLFESTAVILPTDVNQIFMDQMDKISREENKEAAGLGAVVSLSLALWAGTRGTKGMIQGLNIAYRERERRGFFKKILTSIVLTLVLIGVGIAGILLVAMLPALLGFLPISSFAETAVAWLRWPILLVTNMLVLAIMYRYAASREAPRWNWVSTGAIFATAGWLGVSAGFSFYVSNFASYNETYGSLGAAVILLMWLYLSAFLILVGAVINAEMEHQTGCDTTEGDPEPMGERGAYVADHVGPKPG